MASYERRRHMSNREQEEKGKRRGEFHYRVERLGNVLKTAEKRHASRSKSWPQLRACGSATSSVCGAVAACARVGKRAARAWS